MSSAANAYAQQRKYYLEFQSVHTEAQSVRFKALLTTFSQDFQSSWNSQTVFGRMDPIYTFQNTQRSITLAWKTISWDIDEALGNLEKINKLARMLYPTYDASPRVANDTIGVNALTIAKPPLMRVRFVNWMNNGEGKGLMAVIEGFSFEPDLNEEGVFDMPGMIVPKTINCSCNIKVLHEYDLGWNDKGQWLGNTEEGGKQFPFASGLSIATPSEEEVPSEEVETLEANVLGNSTPYDPLGPTPTK